MLPHNAHIYISLPHIVHIVHIVHFSLAHISTSRFPPPVLPTTAGGHFSFRESRVCGRPSPGWLTASATAGVSRCLKDGPLRIHVTTDTEGRCSISFVDIY